MIQQIFIKEIKVTKKIYLLVFRLMTISIFRSKGRYLWELGTGGGVEGKGELRKQDREGEGLDRRGERSRSKRGICIEKHIRFAFQLFWNSIFKVFERYSVFYISLQSGVIWFVVFPTLSIDSQINQTYSIDLNNHSRSN